MAAEQLVAMELKCEELHRAADEAEMASDKPLSMFIAVHSHQLVTGQTCNT